MTTSTTSNAQWQSAFTQAYLKLREENPTLPISGTIEMAKGEANAEMIRFEVACITLNK